MNDKSFPTWSAPLVGLAIGLLIGSKIAIRENLPADSQAVIMGGGLGLGAGLIIWVIDMFRGRSQS